MPDEEFVARDFVYAGERTLTDHSVGHCVYLVHKEGNRVEDQPRFYGSKSLKKGKVIGGIYRGAEFTSEQVRGLGSAVYVGKSTLQHKLIEWQAKHEACRLEHAAARLEKNAKTQNLIDQCLEPLRKIYHDARRRRGDYALAMAIQQSMINSLHKPVKE